MTERLARACARHAWRTVAVWGIVVVASMAAVVLLLGDALESDQNVLNNPESDQAYELIGERLPPDPGEVNYGDEVIVVRSPTITADDPRFERKVEEVAEAVEGTGAALRLRTYLTDPDAGLLSPDRDAAVIPIEMGPNPEGNISKLIEVANAADREPFDVTITGEWTVDEDFNKLAQEDLKNGELFFGAPAALIVLLLVFGSVVAGVIPLVLALVAVLVGLALVGVFGLAFDFSIFTTNMLGGMGLALGIDYALFVLSRFREERVAGREKLDAIGAAGAHSSRAVLFSGIAFVLAMTGLLLVPDTIFRSLAAGAIFAAIVAVLGALTLLPALLSLLGDGVNALRLPYFGKRVTGEGGFWSGVVDRVLRRPALSLAVSTAFLVALALPVLQLEFGFAGIRTLPDRFESKQGFLALEEEFGVGTVNSTIVVVDGEVGSPPVRSAIDNLVQSMRESGDFRAPSVEPHPEASLAIVEALPVGDSDDSRAVAAVEELRATDVPAAFDGVDARVLVTGETAETVDYFALVRQWLPIVIVFVLGLSFILLTVAFRSIVVAGTAIALNLLSVGAAYGLLVLVFVKGIGNELFGFPQVDTVVAWVPLFLFSVLFGLSMDYHVFLLSRIRERYGRSGDTDDAIRHSVASTGRIITGAALIIVAVFAGFARGDLVQFQQMGFGIAVALLIDATLIRCVLLPAAMKLLGNWNWYLPRWLGWLPHFDVEGDSGASRATAR